MSLHIASALNDMGDNIGKLINEVYLADLQKNKRNWNHACAD